ncbi:MAG: tyrosine-type recombinase/integrase, partial [Xenococcaceae cyanobacterium]
QSLPFSTSITDLIEAWQDFLESEVGSGAATGDTLRTYNTQIKQYLNWCYSRRVAPITAQRKDIKAYRHHLVVKGYKKATISLKLTAVRQFYQAAIEAELMTINPAVGIKPPHVKVAPSAKVKYLQIEEVDRLLATVSQTNPIGKVGIDNQIKPLRDLALVEIMVYEGARPIELHRANIGDIRQQGDRLGISVSSKRSERIVPLTPQIASLLLNYLDARKQAGEKLNKFSPLFAAVGNRSRGQRLSRVMIYNIVDTYLKESGLKNSGGRSLTPYSLRHTAGTQGLAATGELRRVQDFLGHSDPKITAIYAQADEGWTNNPALSWEKTQNFPLT